MLNDNSKYLIGLGLVAVDMTVFSTNLAAAARLKVAIAWLKRFEPFPRAADRERFKKAADDVNLTSDARKIALSLSESKLFPPPSGLIPGSATSAFGGFAELLV